MYKVASYISISVLLVALTIFAVRVFQNPSVSTTITTPIIMSSEEPVTAFDYRVHVTGAKIIGFECSSVNIEKVIAGEHQCVGMHTNGGTVEAEVGKLTIEIVDIDTLNVYVSGQASTVQGKFPQNGVSFSLVNNSFLRVDRVVVLLASLFVLLLGVSMLLFVPATRNI